MKTTIATIKANNLLAGKFYFSRKTMRFFKSKVYPTVYGGKYFVTRETNWAALTRWSVREAIGEGREIRTCGTFFSYISLEDAQEAAKKLGKESVNHETSHL